MVLCSRVADDVAHITQLCVAKNWRGHHLGRTLLKHCMSHLAQSGFEAITLTVTEANHQAVKLYEDLGFHTRHRFEAMVSTKPESTTLRVRRHPVTSSHRLNEMLQWCERTSCLL